MSRTEYLLGVRVEGVPSFTFQSTSVTCLRRSLHVKTCSSDFRHVVSNSYIFDFILALLRGGVWFFMDCSPITMEGGTHVFVLCVFLLTVIFPFRTSGYRQGPGVVNILRRPVHDTSGVWGRPSLVPGFQQNSVLVNFLKPQDRTRPTKEPVTFKESLHYPRLHEQRSIKVHRYRYRSQRTTCIKGLNYLIRKIKYLKRERLLSQIRFGSLCPPF